MRIPKAVREQQQEVQALIDRVNFLVAKRRRLDGVRQDFTFVNEVTFLQRDTSAQDIIFQIPDNSDFVAKRLMILPYFRFTTTDTATNGVAEISYRPCIFTHTSYAFNNLMSVDQAAVDISVQLSESGCEAGRALQNAPTPIAAMGCAPICYRPAEIADLESDVNATYIPSFEHAQTIDFPDQGYDLLRGTNLSVRISPTYASERNDENELNADPTLQNEYKVIATLEGYRVML